VQEFIVQLSDNIICSGDVAQTLCLIHSDTLYTERNAFDMKSDKSSGGFYLF